MMAAEYGSAYKKDLDSVQTECYNPINNLTL